jgi:hypothetical protein
MFEDLWQEWIDTKLYLMAKGTPVLEEGYEGVFNSLTDEQQRELMEKKADFAKMSGIDVGLH